MTKYFPRYVKRYLTLALAIITAFVGIAFILVKVFSISYFIVSGESMSPTYRSGEVLFVQKSKRDFDKGNIVIFEKPKDWVAETHDNPKTLIKRIIAAPDDTISFDGSAFYVNNKEFFSITETNYPCEVKKPYTHKLTDTQLFVMGDNSVYSSDSKYFFCLNDNVDFYVNPDTVYFSGKPIVSF